MNEQDKLMATVIENEQRSKSNVHRLDALEDEIKDIKREQKAIYSIATSVEVIAQRITHIEAKVDDTNRKVDAQAETLRNTERRLSEKVSDAEAQPYKKTANNANSIKVAIITAVLTALASSAVVAVVTLIK